MVRNGTERCGTRRNLGPSRFDRIVPSRAEWVPSHHVFSYVIETGPVAFRGPVVSPGVSSCCPVPAKLVDTFFVTYND